MKRRLYIILPLIIDDPWAWAILQDDAVIQSGRACNADDKATLSGLQVDAVIAVLPGQYVRVFAHDLPPARLNERLRAAAYSIEDRLGAPVDTQHVVLGSDKDARIMVVERHYLEVIMTALGACDLSPEHIVADFDTFAPGDTVFGAFERIIVPGPLGYSLDLDWANELSPSMQMKPLDDQAAFASMAAHLLKYVPLDLRQGAFAKHKIGGDMWMIYARVAMLVLAFGLSLLLWHGAQAYALSKMTAKAKDEAATLYVAAMRKPAPPNPALFLTQRTRESPGASAPFLHLSQILFDAVAEVEGMTVEQMQYNREGEPALKLRLSYPAFETASTFEDAIARHGGRLQSGGIREAGDGLSGEATLLSIKEPAR